ncbi:MAG: hypothetical protein WC862_05315 [Patescibacteria group bacterium]
MDKLNTGDAFEPSADAGVRKAEGKKGEEKDAGKQGTVIVPAPISIEMKERMEVARQRSREADKEIERRVADFRAQLRRELADEAENTLERESKSIGLEAWEKIHRWLEEIYNGKYGRGVLVVVEDSARSGENRVELRRVVPICNAVDHESVENTDREVESLARHRLLQGRNVYRHNKTDEALEAKTFGFIGQSLRMHQFAEVGSVDDTKEELNELFRILIESRILLLSDILEAFPKDYKPQVEPGEVWEFGSCSHHSGKIFGKQIVLPTGRLAVVSEYTGEFPSSNRFWGVLTDPRVKPDWSARFGGEWRGPQLEIPTAEEIAFLRREGKGEKFSWTEKMGLESDDETKMIGSEGEE